MSALFPSEIICENPILLSQAMSKIAVQNAPDWDTKAIFPPPGFCLANERFIFALLFIYPRQLGPRSLIFEFFNFSAILSSKIFPSSPVSLKPAVIITTDLIFFCTH